MSAWPFAKSTVIIYDSFERPGYPRTPENPQGWHKAHDASRYRKDDGSLVSLAGTKLFSPVDGVVHQEGWDNAWGWYIRIRANKGDRDVWTYAHFLYRSPLRAGSKVWDGRRNGKWSRKRQTFIGYVGNTGNSTAPHSHSERKDGSSGSPYERGPRKRLYPLYLELQKEAKKVLGR